MSASEELKYVNLIRFDNSYLQPSVEEYARHFKGSRAEDGRYSLTGSATGFERYYLAQLLEGYFWLVLGVALDIFPSVGAQSLVPQRFALVFPEFPTFLESWDFLFDPQLKYLVLTALNQKEFFLERSLKEFEHPETLASSFQSVCLLETRFSLDSDARVFVTALNFYYEHLDRALAKPSRDEAHRAINDLERLWAVPSNSTVKGFLRLIEHIHGVGYLLEHLAASSHVEPKDRQLFEHRVKQICGWRLTHAQRRAYLAMISMVGILEPFVPQDVQRHLDRPSLESELRGMLDDWKGGALSGLSSSSGG